MKNLSIISHNVAETVGKELEKHWLNELKLHPQNPSFLRACLKTYGPRYLWSAFLMLGKKTRSNIAKVILTHYFLNLVWGVGNVTQIFYFTQNIISYVGNVDEPVIYGWGYLIG